MKALLVVLLLSGNALIQAHQTCSSDNCENSCKNCCGDKLDRSYSYQCNFHCERFGDCCNDYSICSYIDSNLNEVTHDHDSDIDSMLNEAAQEEKIDVDNKLHKTSCKEKTEVDVSKDEIKAVSEILYQSDVNKAGESDVTLNKQQMVHSTGEEEDLCGQPLYHYVNEDIFERPTFKAFLDLLDNYDRKTGTDETFSQEKIKEQDIFLQEIQKTKIMKELYKFFNKKGLYGNEQEFLDDLKKMWFGLYSRSSGEQDSSGFEHVFVGEVKKGIVSGFHSWIRFYLLEKKGMVDYHSHNYDGPWTNYPDVLGKQFEWDGFYKEVGTQLIGSSPEFDFALYTLCFISRPGKKCVVSLGGHEVAIQTYEWTKSTYNNGKKPIATAYVTF